VCASLARRRRRRCRASSWATKRRRRVVVGAVGAEDASYWAQWAPKTRRRVSGTAVMMWRSRSRCECERGAAWGPGNSTQRGITRLFRTAKHTKLGSSVCESVGSETNWGEEFRNTFTFTFTHARVAVGTAAERPHEGRPHQVRSARDDVFRVTVDIPKFGAQLHLLPEPRSARQSCPM